MSAMREMSRAMRLVVEQHAPTVRQLADQPLEEFAAITTAFAQDLRDEIDRRKAASVTS